MKKDTLKKRIIAKKNYDIDYLEENQTMLETLKNAWNNLPSDMNLDEREVFFEIAQKLVKFHNKVKEQFNHEKDLDVN